MVQSLYPHFKIKKLPFIKKKMTDYPESMAQRCNHQKSVLLLGMVYSVESIPKRGQEYRDRVRCQALQGLGFNVRTLDNKHNDVTLENHCNANFADTRRLIKAIQQKWGSKESFNHVILDYFMSPVGWARERWTDPLFTDTFPMLARSGMLAEGALIWLPNLQCIQESLDNFRQNLEPYFNINKESDARLNPLYTATDIAEEELLLCPDLITNKTQVIPLKEHARDNNLFYVLQLKSEYYPTVLQSTSLSEGKRNFDHESVLSVNCIDRKRTKMSE